MQQVEMGQLRAQHGQWAGMQVRQIAPKLKQGPAMSLFRNNLFLIFLIFTAVPPRVGRPELRARLATVITADSNDCGNNCRFSSNRAMASGVSGSPAVLGRLPVRPMTLRPPLSRGMPFTDQIAGPNYTWIISLEYWTEVQPQQYRRNYRQRFRHLIDMSGIFTRK